MKGARAWNLSGYCTTRWPPGTVPDQQVFLKGWRLARGQGLLGRVLMWGCAAASSGHCKGLEWPGDLIWTLGQA